MRDDQIVTVLKNSLSIIGFLFIIELILGFNGTLLLVGRFGIRKVLFTVLVILLGCYLVQVIRQCGLRRLGGYIKPFDIWLLIFLVIQSTWVILIPFYNGQSISLAIKEILSFSMLGLYFVVILLIEAKCLDWNKARLWVKTAVLLLAIVHIVFYIGETAVGDATFVLNFFAWINKVTLGMSKRPFIMMPANYIRIIYPVSIYLLVGIYFSLTVSKWNAFNIIYFGISIVGLMTTLTKSLFIGVIIGVIFFLVGLVLSEDKQYRRRCIWRIICITGVSIYFIGVMDTTVFDGYVQRRMQTIVAINSPEEQKLQPEIYNISPELGEVFKDRDELAGTERSNYTRIIQIKRLLGEWQKNLWVGRGYGSYIEDYRRAGDETPYSYEMFLPALLMKIGAIGVLIWGVAFVYVLSQVIKLIRYDKLRMLGIGYLFIAVVVATQFNPFLINANGMSIILFCLIEIRIALRDERRVA